MTRAISSAAADTALSASAWLAVMGTLAGVLITGVIALTTAILNNRWQTNKTERELRWEHAKQARQDRLDLYSRYWSAWNRLTQLFREVKSEVLALTPSASSQEEGRARVASEVATEIQAATVAWREAYNLVMLIGGEEVVEALNSHRISTSKRLDECWLGEYSSDATTHLALTDAMRSELSAPPRL